MNYDIKELLTLAAKSCGYCIHDWCHGNSTAWAYKLGSELDFYGELPIFKWAPHLDDGDCFRVETELGIIPKRTISYASSWLCLDTAGQLLELVRDEPFKDHNGDKNAARRMASLRVAAELGRRM